MGLLAPGGQVHVMMLTIMGVSALLVGAVIDPVAGIVPLIGMLCLMMATFVAYFWRDPDRPIPKTNGILLSPADGRLMFVVRERAIGRRPVNPRWPPARLRLTRSRAIGGPNPSTIR